MTPRPLLLILLSALASTGCGNEPEPTRSDAVGNDSPDDATDDNDSGADEPNDTTDDDEPGANDDPGVDDDVPRAICEVPQFPSASDNVALQRLEARVVTPEGQPVAGVMAQACGINLCLREDTDANGNVLHTGPHDLQRLAFKYGDGLRYAQFALLLPEVSEHDLGEQLTMALPPLSSGQPFEPGTLRSAGIELDLTEQTTVTVDFLTFSDEEQRFLAAEFPENGFPEAATSEGLDFELLFALAPVKTKFCPPAPLRLPNRMEWSAGQEVELFLHSTDILAEYAPYADWRKVSDAVVSDDAEWIETLGGQGVPMLGALGVRRTP